MLVKATDNQVLEIKAAAAMPVVDLHVGARAGSAAVRNAFRLDAVEDRVELGLADPEGVVVMLEIAALVEIEGQRLIDAQGREMRVSAPSYCKPRTRARKRADASLSCAGTIVWSSTIAIGTSKIDTRQIT